MPDQPDRSAVNAIMELAGRLRDVEHLDPEARAKVAELLRNLAAELDNTVLSADTDHLARSAAQLVRAVEGQHESGLIEAARERLGEAVAKAEANAPVATDLAAQLINLLATLGI
jgi:hypothetical protein